MISAKSYKPDLDRARTLGANDYVVKPFQPDELCRAWSACGPTGATPRLA